MGFGATTCCAALRTTVDSRTRIQTKIAFRLTSLELRVTDSYGPSFILSLKNMGSRRREMEDTFRQQSVRPTPGLSVFPNLSGWVSRLMCTERHLFQFLFFCRRLHHPHPCPSHAKPYNSFPFYLRLGSEPRILLCRDRSPGIENHFLHSAVARLPIRTTFPS